MRSVELNVLHAGCLGLVRRNQGIDEKARRMRDRLTVTCRGKGGPGANVDREMLKESSRERDGHDAR